MLKKLSQYGRQSGLKPDKVISRDDELQLIKRLQESKYQDAEAMQQLVMHNLSFIFSRVHRFTRTGFDRDILDFDDQAHEAVLAFIEKCIPDFDLEKSQHNRLCSHSDYRVDTAIKGIRADTYYEFAGGTTRSRMLSSALQGKLNRFRGKLETERGGAISREELIEEALKLKDPGLYPSLIKAYFSIPRVSSMSARVGSDGEGEVADFIAQPESEPSWKLSIDSDKLGLSSKLWQDTGEKIFTESLIDIERSLTKIYLNQREEILSRYWGFDYSTARDLDKLATDIGITLQSCRYLMREILEQFREQYLPKLEQRNPADAMLLEQFFRYDTVKLRRQRAEQIKLKHHHLCDEIQTAIYDYSITEPDQHLLEELQIRGKRSADLIRDHHGVDGVEKLHWREINKKHNMARATVVKHRLEAEQLFAQIYRSRLMKFAEVSPYEV